jgi:mRNA interferase MazF
MLQQFNRGEIWLIDMTEGVGSEQKMIRPVVIIQNNMGNRYSPCCTIVPLTSQQGKKWMPTHVKLFKTTCLMSLSIALAEQVTTVSKKRFIKFIGKINSLEMMEIEDALMIQMGIGAKNNIAYA